MAIQTINLGTYANDGTGDDLRTAFQKVNANFAELNSEINISSGENLGTGAGVYAKKEGINLQFRSLISTNNTVLFDTTDDTIDISASSMLSTDTSPSLGGNLDLNDFYVFGGDTQTTVYGISVPILNGLVELMIASGQLTIDFGSFLVPTGSKGAAGDKGFNLDMGYFVGAFTQNNIDFGVF